MVRYDNITPWDTGNLPMVDAVVRPIIIRTCMQQSLIPPRDKGTCSLNYHIKNLQLPRSEDYHFLPEYLQEETVTSIWLGKASELT